jgi:hypothetical protein
MQEIIEWMVVFRPGRRHRADHWRVGVDIVGRLKGELDEGTSNPANIRTSFGGVGAMSPRTWPGSASVSG